MIEKDVQEICDKAFANHKATLIQNTERYLIIDWRREDGSGEYYVNYIVDKKRGSLIVSGDLGDSIATWYNPIDPSVLKRWVKNDTGYYISKFQCTTNDFVYTAEDIVSDIKEQLARCDEEDIIMACEDKTYFYGDTLDEVWGYLIEEIEESCLMRNNSVFTPTEYITKFLEELDPDYWEWLYDCGKKIHRRVYLWADGFYKACEQLGI